MDKWETTTIGALGQVFDGPHATPKTISEGPIFLGIGALQDGRINLGETRHVTPHDFEKWTRRVRPQAGDFVFSYETRLGEAAIIPEGMECCLGRRMGLVRVDQNKILPRFFLYKYISPEFQEFLRSRTVHGATVDRILLTEFPEFPFPCPPLDDQQAIVSLLGALDDKIELNRRMNDTLEATARAIFRDWFVDIGPTRAKAEGHAPYLAPELWDLFPNEIGEIPGGWRAGKVSDIALNIRDGRRVDDVADDERYIGLEHFDRRTLTLWRCGSGFAVTSNKSAFETGDLLFGKLRPYFHKVAIAPFPGVCSTDVLVIRPKSPDVACFVYLALSEFAVVDFATKTSTGTRMPRTNWKTLGSYRMAVPDGSIAREFQKIASPMLQQMSLAAEEAGTLAELRDLLLPRLISGQLRVSEAEAMVAAAV